MDQFSDLAYKQLLFPPFRKETGVPNKELPIYAAMNPVIPPFLPYRNVSRFPKYPSTQQQIQIIKTNQEKNRGR